MLSKEEQEGERRLKDMTTEAKPRRRRMGKQE
jgi:hypothetical protein